MRLRNIMLVGTILLAAVFTSFSGMAQTTTTDNTNDINITLPVDDIKENEGSIGPDHALYGLMIAFENLGTTFTFNPEERLGKQVANARQRIAEAKAELRKNNTKAAEKAFEKYDEDMKEADYTLSGISGNNAGLINAQLRIANHRYILENLLNQTPNITGLQKAYNNSLNLEEKFRSKTERRFVQVEMEGGRQGLKEENDISEDEKERTEIRAEVTDSGSIVNIDLRFRTNSTNETDIVADTLRELQNLQTNLSENLKLDQSNQEDFNDHKVELATEAQVRMNVTDVIVQYTFHLNESTKEDIVNAIDVKLSDLRSDEILNGLELKLKENKRIENDKENENQEDNQNTKSIGNSSEMVRSDEKSVENERIKDESQKITENGKRSDR